MEVFNSDCAFECDRGGGSALLDQLLVAGRRIGAIAVDDAHFYQAEAPGGWVMVKASQNEPDAILAALKAGAYYASQGPSLLAVERVGDHLHFETSPIDRLHLVGRGPKQVAVTGRGLTRARLPLEKFAGAWCRAIAIDADGKRAWTNPLWLD